MGKGERAGRHRGTSGFFLCADLLVIPRYLKSALKSAGEKRKQRAIRSKPSSGVDGMSGCIHVCSPLLTSVGDRSKSQMPVCQSTTRLFLKEAPYLLAQTSVRAREADEIARETGRPIGSTCTPYDTQDKQKSPSPLRDERTFRGTTRIQFSDKREMM